MCKCVICGALANEVFRETVLKKYEAVYNRCASCGFLQAEKPHWLDEAYNDAIATADTGLVERNFSIASRLAPTLYFGLDRSGTYIDVAGGYGMLVRLMRDFGFEFFWDDKYCQNLMAKGYEASVISAPVSGLTAFEVMEHLVDPLDFVSEQMSRFQTKTMIFTTELYTGEQAPPKDWWYYVFPTGQHISFFQERTLHKMANKLGISYYSIAGLHIFSDRDIRNHYLLSNLKSKILMLSSFYVKRKLISKTMSDHIEQLEK